MEEPSASVTPSSQDDAAWPDPVDVKVVLQQGDTIEVQFLAHPELRDEQIIRPDGKISLQIVGEVMAAGLAPEELRGKLVEMYRDQLKKPDINVVVRSFESRRIYVGGEVKTPGLIPLKGDMTALDAVLQAGGFLKESAKLNSVVIIRRRGDEQWARAIDLRKPLRDAKSRPFYLEPYDVVYVPRTAIDHVDQWVEQYINKIVPRNLHYAFSQNINPQTIQSKQVQVAVPALQ